MGNKIKYFALLLASAIEYLTLHSWFVCKNFSDIFHHTSINLTLQLTDYIHEEKGTTIIVTRLFNNKYVEGTLDFLRFYIQFWDVRFGSIWFSLIGYSGIIFGFYYLFATKKKTVFHWTILLVILALPLIEIYAEPRISIVVKSIYFWLPFVIFSLYGMYQFLSHGNIKKRLIIMGIIIIVSILWLMFIPYDMPRYCIK